MFLSCVQILNVSCRLSRAEMFLKVKLKILQQILFLYGDWYKYLIKANSFAKMYNSTDELQIVIWEHVIEPVLILFKS